MILTRFGIPTGIAALFIIVIAMTLPTLAVEPHEAGAVAGLIIATNTLAFTIGPAGAGWLYGYHSALPFAVSAVLLAGLRVFLQVSRHPSLARPGNTEKGLN